MLQVQVSTPSPEPSYPPTLADLSRNASVISTSSSDSGPSLHVPPPRPRPIRTFSSPRSLSPHTRTTRSPRGSMPPSYLANELGSSDEDNAEEIKRATARARSRSQNPSTNGRLNADDFQFGKTLGEGSYSTVMRGTYLPTGQQYAIKILDKNHLLRNNKLKTANAEKNALVKLGSGHPGIVRLHWAFHDQWSLYFVLDLAPNGEMQSRISQLGSLSIQCTQYYAAQIVDAVAYMHSKGVIHRDLKPENVLLDENFRIKITDFGTGKILESGTEKATTFVGTSQYVSPELLEANETSKSSDFWALGCIIYQMIAGRFAFQGLSEYLTWQKIKQLDYDFPEGFDEQAKDIVQKLLVRDPAARLGAGPDGSVNDMKALRAHPFFSSINWQTLWTAPVPPLEAGLVKRQHPLSVGHDSNWEDVGAAWDDLVGNNEDVDDGVNWASDGEGCEFELRRNEVGPMGETPCYPQRMDNGNKVRPANDQLRIDGVNGLELVDGVYAEGSSAVGLRNQGQEGEPTTVSGHISNAVVDSVRGAPELYSTASATSSSEGSPTENLGAVLQAMKLASPETAVRPSLPESAGSAGSSGSRQLLRSDTDSELRGRNRALTPVQGNGPLVEFDASSILLPGENILFKSSVETRSTRRRASRLIPIPVHPVKPKTRQLILTSLRLLCLKERTKGQLTVKFELGLRASDKDKEKDKERESRSIISSAEPKGEREFVVMTSTKCHTFVALDSSLASTWIQKIDKALETHGRQTSKART